MSACIVVAAIAAVKDGAQRLMANSKERSAVLEEIGRFSIREFDLPRIGDDDALLRVEMAGVCRTDASFYRGKTRRHLIPLILGHEILGRIARIGSRAARDWRLREGDRVVVESSIRCQHCRYCI